MTSSRTYENPEGQPRLSYKLEDSLSREIKDYQSIHKWFLSNKE